MSATLSPIFTAETAEHGPFSVQRFNLDRFGGAVDPILGLDHYRMNGATFAPHPHAGFSAISYLFEDSAGGLRNRDSLGHDFVVEPGGIVWTQAGAGVMHDELPAEPGRQVHGLQIFVNLSAANKDTDPQVHRLSAAEVPIWTSAKGTRLRVVVGAHEGVRSPLQPTELFNLFDIGFASADEILLPLAVGWDVLIYAPEGLIGIDAGGRHLVLKSAEAVGIVAKDGSNDVWLSGDTGGRAVILSGRALREPVVQYGPFIMNTRAQISAAVARYHAGEMGRLATLS